MNIKSEHEFSYKLQEEIIKNMEELDEDSYEIAVQIIQVSSLSDRV